ncbi:MAG: LacI family DNA-binding transcriptional regulator [Bacteroidaceae bacterium]|nr:LacI family transcriptional regulator [Bacteroidales bacterium]MBQ2979205.1 LacI family DNA-binding transcriptional regulator [Bacteroidaceae bacterium]
MSSHITIKDIAKAMGCAPSTVSRALNNSANISPAVREAIQRYALEHNYRPNEFALSLRNNRSNTIGVILPQIVHYFFSSVLSGIEKAAAAAGYNIIVAQSNEEYEKEVAIVESFRKAKVCGVIASLAKGTYDFTHFRRLVDEEVPLVFYDRICTELNTSRVVVDDYTGAFAAVEHLIETGCSKIAFYTSPLHLEISKNRRNGYVDALRKHRIEVDNDMIIECDNRARARELTMKLISSPERPDAFFAVNADTAAGILYACKDAGLRVPEDVSICGFSDNEMARSTEPRLSMVDQPGEAVGQGAMELLLAKIDGNEEKLVYKNKIVKTSLILRGTTREK